MKPSNENQGSCLKNGTKIKHKVLTTCTTANLRTKYGDIEAVYSFCLSGLSIKQPRNMLQIRTL